MAKVQMMTAKYDEQMGCGIFTPISNGASNMEWEVEDVADECELRDVIDDLDSNGFFGDETTLTTVMSSCHNYDDGVAWVIIRESREIDGEEDYDMFSYTWKVIED
jgi:hypothetical protein